MLGLGFRAHRASSTDAKSIKRCPHDSPVATTITTQNIRNGVKGWCHQGTIKGGDFDLPGSTFSDKRVCTVCGFSDITGRGTMGGTNGRVEHYLLTL